MFINFEYVLVGANGEDKGANSVKAKKGGTSVKVCQREHNPTAPINIFISLYSNFAFFLLLSQLNIGNNFLCLHIRSLTRRFSFERNCVLRQWESETLKYIINHKVNKSSNFFTVANLPF